MRVYKYIQIFNIGSKNTAINQSRGTFGQMSALRGSKSLYDTLFNLIVSLCIFQATILVPVYMNQDMLLLPTQS